MSSLAPLPYRVAIGRYVADRLARAPEVLKIPSSNLDIYVAREFLTAKECQGFIERIDKDRIPSQLLASGDDPGFRTSESCNLRPDDPLVIQIEGKLNLLIGIQPAHGETVQGQRYAVGQQFKLHHDFFHIHEPYWAAMEACGGQRTWTAMAFLNTPEGGGQTSFDAAEIKVSPRAGNLLIWNNLDAEGNPNAFSMHQGCPVTAGVKYVITKWYRERPWSYSDVQTY